MRLRTFFRHFRIYFFVTFITMGLFSFIRMGAGAATADTVANLDSIEEVGLPQFFALAILFMSFWLGILSSLIDIFTLPRIVHKKPLWKVLFIGLVVQVAAIGLITSVAIGLFTSMLGRFSESVILQPTFNQTYPLVVAIVFSTLLSRIFVEVDKKFGPGNLWKMLTGKFYEPREEVRIFMFVDLKGSTSIAERIGYIEFSKLLKDCFHDFAIVDNYHAEIYQYVGDEVVISWSPKDGLKNDNFLKAFFAFDALLSEKAETYKKEHDVIPFFKASANMGPVIVTEVGEIKQEITYHGDTLNTAARIQGMCNDFNAQLLIPEDLYEKVKETMDFVFEAVGSTKLKGKEKEVSLYSVKPKA